MRRLSHHPFIAIVLVLSGVVTALVTAATVVPNEIQQPGTQPTEVGTLETPDKCDNCHGGYDKAVEPSFNWRGSLMANATRDPIFWATVAVAEQDFDGSGDLCIRCHSTSGWYGGRSTPTDGSGLAAGDADGVECDSCHKMTNPDDSEHLGVMIAPFLAHDEQTPKTGYYGSGMLSLFAGSAKLGPYSDPDARHQFLQSRFHRSREFCGSCHDVSNPAVGDLAPGNGAQPTGDAVVASGVPGAPLTAKAAFNNFPYRYGVVERTFSEHMSSALPGTLVSAYAGLPADLRAGAVQAGFDAAKGNYADGTLRYFTCQTCHVRPTTGQGCNKAGVPTRTDLPLHDMTGGNYWVPDAILYQNTHGLLRLGGGLNTVQIEALQAGKARAEQQLRLAASLSVSGNTLKVVNLTGHKLISGYPEGRRMWLNVKWYDGGNTLVREDGQYGPMTVTLDGQPAEVDTILNPADPNTKIYEAHYAMTQAWAATLVGLGYPATLPLSFDRVTGSVEYTLGGLATQSPGTYHETFHFVLNNHVAKDNRIPPYGFRVDEARRRNALPVPAGQYGSPAAGGTYNYWDELTLNPPAGAARAEIRLLYQPTSWEYIQFLHLANTGANSFLAAEGLNLLTAWRNTGMAAPFVMAAASWQASVVGFGKTSPVSGAAGQPTSVWLSWTSAGGAATYEYCIDAVNDSQCTAPATWTSAGSSTSVLRSGLNPNATYYWQVRSNPGPVYADTGAWWAFTTLPLPGAFGKIHPAEGQRTSLNPVCSWSPSTGVTGYEICVDTTNNQACDTAWIPVQTAQSVWLQNQSIGVTHYWQVRAVNGAGATYANAGAWWSYLVRRTPTDEDRDGLADPIVWRAPTGTWYVRRSGTSTMAVVQWGSSAANDQPAPGDYDGDGRMDIAVWRPATGTWHIIPSSGGLPVVQQWGSGALGDVPVPADYDGDGRTDVAVWRASTGDWYVLASGGGSHVDQWGSGTAGDQAVPADYDGDGKADLAVWRSTTGVWHIQRSSTGVAVAYAWGSGTAGDKVVPGDYDGDGKADPAVWRPATGTWYILQSSGGPASVTWGAAADTPMPSDYDGDGRTDFAVWRPGNGNWYILRSHSYSALVLPFGLGAAGDIPVGER